MSLTEAALGAGHELVLGGARSGKSRTAEARAAAWLDGGPARRATLLATALPGDAEMAERIARHRGDRAMRVPALATVEAPYRLGEALRATADPATLVVVDCLTLWLTQCLWPPGAEVLDTAAWRHEADGLIEALIAHPAPVVLVSNEIGLGVLPMGREARACVDALGLLHQRVAATCARITLMVAGCELTVKDRR